MVYRSSDFETCNKRHMISSRDVKTYTILKPVGDRQFQGGHFHIASLANVFCTVKV